MLGFPAAPTSCTGTQLPPLPLQGPRHTLTGTPSLPRRPQRSGRSEATPQAPPSQRSEGSEATCRMCHSKARQTLRGPPCAVGAGRLSRDPGPGSWTSVPLALRVHLHKDFGRATPEWAPGVRAWSPTPTRWRCAEGPASTPGPGRSAVLPSARVLPTAVRVPLSLLPRATAAPSGQGRAEQRAPLPLPLWPASSLGDRGGICRARRPLRQVGGGLQGHLSERAQVVTAVG